MQSRGIHKEKEKLIRADEINAIVSTKNEIEVGKWFGIRDNC